MGDSSRCSICGQPATVDLTQIDAGKFTKVHLCDACAQKGGATDPSVFKLADALAAPSAPAAIVCPACGFTDVDFRKRGRLGCPACWTVFADALGGLLSKVQHDAAHQGRAPAGSSGAAGPARVRLESARRELEAAVKAEAFETAARLRDEILRLEAVVKSS
ncbi:MAG: UvrB/UvrC motif-containing protein [Opitutales bacterium]